MSSFSDGRVVVALSFTLKVRLSIDSLKAQVKLLGHGQIGLQPKDKAKDKTAGATLPALPP